MDLFNKNKLIKNLQEINVHNTNVIAMQDRIIKSLEDEITSKRKENEKLIDWIMSILKEFGTMDVKDDMSHVAIPVKRKVESVYSMSEGMGTLETINIPSITIEKVVYHRNDK